MIREIGTSLVATAGAYAGTADPATSKYMAALVKNTPLDPSTLAYASEGMNPGWAFATVCVIGMGGHLSKACGQFLTDRSADMSRREAAKRGEMLEPDA